MPAREPSASKDRSVMAAGSPGLKMAAFMEPNARICDVVHTLDDPIEYVRGVVGSFFEYQFDQSTSVVRIGISGTGIVPNYSIETPRNPNHARTGEPAVSKRHVFNGRNHREILDDCPSGESWSLKLDDVARSPSPTRTIAAD
jgi:hypothetical protein